MPLVGFIRSHFWKYDGVVSGQVPDPPDSRYVQTETHKHSRTHKQSQEHERDTVEIARWSWGLAARDFLAQRRYIDGLVSKDRNSCASTRGLRPFRSRPPIDVSVARVSDTILKVNSYICTKVVLPTWLIGISIRANFASSLALTSARFSYLVLRLSDKSVFAILPPIYSRGFPLAMLSAGEWNSPIRCQENRRRIISPPVNSDDIIYTWVIRATDSCRSGSSEIRGLTVNISALLVNSPNTRDDVLRKWIVHLFIRFIFFFRFQGSVHALWQEWGWNDHDGGARSGHALFGTETVG